MAETSESFLEEKEIAMRVDAIGQIMPETFEPAAVKWSCPHTSNSPKLVLVHSTSAYLQNEMIQDHSIALQGHGIEP